MKKSQSIFLLAILSCNAKGVECADSTQPCVSTQVNDDSHELSFGDNTYDNDQSNMSTTINNDTTIINNPVVTVSPNGGSGGDTSGAAGAGGNAYDAGVPDSSTVTCDSPNAVPSDVRNWFTTNGPSPGWFQLITAEGFSVDRCIYTGKVKWFYEGPDGYWESDREYDSPDTIITLRFEQNGDTKVNVHPPTEGYPIGSAYPSNIEYETCAPACVIEGTCGDNTCSSSYASYSQKVCFRPGAGYNCWSLRVSAFRGEWQLDHPVVTQQVYPSNAG